MERWKAAKKAVAWVDLMESCLVAGKAVSTAVAKARRWVA